MGITVSREARNRAADESTSNASLSALRYVNVHEKPRWKSMFGKKETAMAAIPRRTIAPPRPVGSHRPSAPYRPVAPPRPSGAYKTAITPGGVTMVYPQKKKFIPSFRGRLEINNIERPYPTTIRTLPKGGSQKSPVWKINTLTCDNRFRSPPPVKKHKPRRFSWKGLA